MIESLVRDFLTDWASPHSWLMRAALVIMSLLVDAAIGDPPGIPHPVVQIGRLISFMERRLQPVRQRKLAGIALAFVVPVTSAGVVGLLVWAAGLLHPLVGMAAAVWIASTTIAARGLAKAGWRVKDALDKGDLPEARQRVGEIVGRDTDTLNEAGVTRATVETVAENCVDACVSPLFFTLLGGAPGAMLYRAINTLDSMVGYKNERYIKFGWASARLDDVVNWVPARITAIVLPLSATLCGTNGLAAWRTILSDARKHPSPNSGIPESGVAGALGVQLGGTNYYGGIPHHRALMGEPLNQLVPRHISQAARIMFATAACCAIVFALAGWLIAQRA